GDKFGAQAAGAAVKVGLVVYAARELIRMLDGVSVAAGNAAGVEERNWWITKFGKKLAETVTMTEAFTKALQYAQLAAAAATGNLPEYEANKAAMGNIPLGGPWNRYGPGLRYTINPKAYGSANDVMPGAVEEFKAERGRQLDFDQRIASAQRERAALQGNEQQVRKLDAAIAALNIQQLQLQGYSLAAAQAIVYEEAQTRKFMESLSKSKALSDFQSWMKQLAAEASGAGTDPLTQKLAEIEQKRLNLLQQAKDKQFESKGAISSGLLQQAIASIEKGAERSSSEEINKPVLDNARRVAQAKRDIELDMERKTEDDRLALIQDANQRELAQNEATVRRWAEDRRRAIDDFYGKQIDLQERALQEAIKSDDAYKKKNAEKIAQSIVELRKQKSAETAIVDQAEDEQDRIARARYQRRLDEQMVGTKAWADKLGAALKAQFQKIGDIVIDMTTGVRGALADAINGFLDDLTSGQADAMKTLGGLANSLARVWARALTQILMNGDNVLGQLRALWDQLGQGGMKGALAGAGFGGFVGGFFQKPGNYAQAGGSIGGGIGQALGLYLTSGSAVGGAIGSVIGSVIGTYVGSLIQKGKDWIKVAIVNGVATVTEKGISAEARHDLETQINRRIHDEMKGWQGILDLFPERVREAIKDLHPTLNLNGGVD
ncbi:MAG TPA: hypothetical protein VLN59_12635, partial [Burkholderiales bacterium]|nr:hypothetical protein [Burkholderiales bacterium]